MSDTKHVVLIHGAWSRGEQLAAARAAFEERGYTAHTPTLRYHELPMQEGATKVASLVADDMGWNDDDVRRELGAYELLVRREFSAAGLTL